MRTHTALLKDAFAIFKDHIGLFLYIFIIPALVNIGVGVLLESMENETEILPIITILPLPVFLLVIVNLIMAIAMVKAVSSPNETSYMSAYAFAAKNFFPYLWVSILVGVVTFVGFILLIIPGIIFTVWFSFSYFTLLFESKKGIEALKASREYVRGKWIPIFGRMVFLFFIAIVASLAVGFLFGINAETRNDFVSLIVTQALNFILVPVSVAYMYLLYTDVRGIGSGESGQHMQPEQPDVQEVSSQTTQTVEG